MTLVIAAAVYFFVVHFFFSKIVSLPHDLVAPRVNRRGLLGQRVTAAKGTLLTLALSILGIALWFALCVVPITMYAARLNVMTPPIVWFVIPVVAGMAMRRLVGRASAV